MAAPTNLITTADITVTAREIDFVTQFANDWQHLRDIMGVMRVIKKVPGTVLKSKYAQGTLESGDVGEGEVVPFSKYTVKEKTYEEITLQKHATGVSIEAIIDDGYDVAGGMTSEQFRFDITNKITNKFYTYLNTGTLKLNETTWQRALAMSLGSVANKFKTMHKNYSRVIGFANVLDLYDYYGDANITTQTENGLQYIKNFMGYETIVLLGESEIKRGRVIATPADNIALYYVDPSNSELNRAGFTYTTDGVTNLIGYKITTDYDRNISKQHAIYGITLFAEYLDGIAVADVAAGA